MWTFFGPSGISIILLFYRVCLFFNSWARVNCHSCASRSSFAFLKPSLDPQIDNVVLNAPTSLINIWVMTLDDMLQTEALPAN